MKYTLLELVQRVLSSMESDEVSDVNETQESVDVANIVRECYYDIVGYGELKEHESVFNLVASGDDTKPVLMTLPSNCIRLDWVKYNKGTIALPDYSDLRMIDNDEFFHFQTGVDTASSTVDQMTSTIDGASLTFHFRTDRVPTYYTIFNDETLIFDSVDLSVDTTLVSAKTIGHGLLSPTFSLTNTFIPDLDHRQFQLLLQDAKATAHIELKQSPHPRAEQKYRWNRVLAQKTRDDNDPRNSSQRAIRFGRTPR